MNLENVKAAIFLTGFAVVVLALWLIPPNIALIERALEGAYLRHLQAEEGRVWLQIRETPPAAQLDELADKAGTIHRRRLQFEKTWGFTVSKEDAQELKAEAEAEQLEDVRAEANAAEATRLLKKCQNLNPQLQDPCISIVLDTVTRSVLAHSPVTGETQACAAMQKDPDLRRACVEEEKPY